MNVVEISPTLAFHPLLLISSKSNSAKKSSSNSSTLSFTMMKLLKDELLAGVKMKSVLVLSTSVRNVSTWKDSRSFTYNYIFIERTELHSSDRIGRQGKKDQQPSSNLGPALYRGVSATPHAVPASKHGS